jgi:hypothetical protein
MTAAKKGNRTGGSNKEIAVGRTAQIMTAMPPIQTMPAAKWVNLISSYIHQLPAQAQITRI